MYFCVKVPRTGDILFDFVRWYCYISFNGENNEKYLEIYCNNCRRNFSGSDNQGNIAVSDNGHGALVWCGVGRCAGAVFDDPGVQFL